MVKFACRFHNDCDTCPFPQCMVGSGVYLVAEKKKTEAIRLAELGYSGKDIAKALDRSRGQVRRYLRR